MSDSFVDYLNTISASGEAVENAARSVVSGLSDDPTPEQMKAAIEAAAVDKSSLESALRGLSGSASSRREVALAILSAAWADRSNRGAIRAAFDGAQDKMPVVESALLALVGMYGMYLIATGGVAREVHRVKYNEDGTYEEVREVEYTSPTGALSLIPKIFGASVDEETK